MSEWRLLRFGLLCLGVFAGTFALPGFVCWFLTDCTEYSPGYTERAFNAIGEGMSRAEVRRLLGDPLQTVEHEPVVIRYFGPPGSWVGPDGGLHCPGPGIGAGTMLGFDAGGAAVKWGPSGWFGKSADEVRAALGPPFEVRVSRATVFWKYTRAKPKGDYYRRRIGFDDTGRVVEKVAYWYVD
jgi:hypothetical protein